MTPEVLPQTGVIVENDAGVPVCAGFIYKTDSKICWLEFIVSDPLSDTLERGRALDTLIDSLVSRAKQMEFSVMFTSSNHERLIKRYENHEFQVTDRNVTHLVRQLCQPHQQ